MKYVAPGNRYFAIHTTTPNVHAPMNAFLLSIGDELVLGQTIDTNSAWMAQQLAAAGCDIAGHMTVGDEQTAVEHAIASAADLCDVLVISGGIGPTEDDLTRQALASVLGVPLESNADWLKHIEDYFMSRGRAMPERNRVQALIPQGAQMIWNHAGTAAGIRAEIKRKSPGARRPSEGGDGSTRVVPHATNTVIFSTPGVPKEMKAMFTRDVLPFVAERAGGAVILQKTLHTFGLGESALAERLGELMQRGNNPSVGTTVANGLVSLRVNARFATADEAKAQLQKTVAACRQSLGALIFGEDDETLPEVVMRLLTGKTNVTLATAESCTGGWLAKMLTDLPGSSAHFLQGWVTYTNESKIAQLGVLPATLAAHGAVSEAVACEMAAGARERAKTDYALAITGVAGPGGGTPEKPVGMVCFAMAYDGGCDTRTFNMFGDRDMVRDRSAKMALTMLRFHLLSQQLPL